MATSLLGFNLRSILRNKVWAGFNISQFRQVSEGTRMRSNGAIRRGGGAFSKRQEAMEEMYFKKKERELIDTMKSHHKEEISAQEKEVKRLQENIEWHKEKLENLDEQKSSD